MKKSKDFTKALFGGAAVGALNGMFGAGGGIACVILLLSMGFERKMAHKNAIAVMLPITVVSATLYLLLGRVSLLDAAKYIPGGLLGAAVGSILMNKLPQKWIRRISGAFMIWAGWRLLF